MKKIAFSSGEIEAATGVRSRELIYMVDSGYITPDIRNTKPRMFSLYQAVLAGMIRIYQNHGFILKRAHELALQTTDLYFSNSLLEKEMHTIEKSEYHEISMNIRATVGYILRWYDAV